jgi:hypothetical protein
MSTGGGGHEQRRARSPSVTGGLPSLVLPRNSPCPETGDPARGTGRSIAAVSSPDNGSAFTARRFRENLESGRDSTELDLGADARLFPAEPGRLAPTLSGAELAVDKVLAVFGRAEARDFVDLAAVEGRYGLDRLFEPAAEKGRGFTPEMFGDMAGHFSRLRQDEFGLDAGRYEELARRVATWREHALGP